jgi:Fe-S-cluster containining protein
MNLTPGPFLINRRRYLPLLSRLEILFDEMDRAYAQVSDRYGFQCNGCSDNCCLTRFYHHTLLEYLYLVEGMRSLEPDRRRSIRKAALAANTRMDEADQRGETLHIMCPLNRDGQCVAYPYRPMICRLHGIPHELHRPGGKIIKIRGAIHFSTSAATAAPPSISDSTAPLFTNKWRCWKRNCARKPGMPKK